MLGLLEHLRARHRDRHRPTSQDRPDRDCRRSPRRRECRRRRDRQPARQPPEGQAPATRQHQDQGQLLRGSPSSAQRPADEAGLQGHAPAWLRHRRQSKVKALIAMGIPPKKARILAENAKALAAIGNVRAALAALQNKRIINQRLEDRVRHAAGAAPADAPPDAAPGRPSAPSSARAAAASSSATGRRADMVDRPTVMDLGPRTPWSRRTRATAAARSASCSRRSASRATRRARRRRRRRPKRSRSRTRSVRRRPRGRSSRAERDQARERYQKRKDRVHDLDVDIREQRKKVAEAKGG